MAPTSVDLLIFDLDGTLIESKWDIAHSVNFTLVELGLPERPIEEIFGFVGDGVKRLLRLAVGEGNQARFEEALKVFRGYYLEHCLTEPPSILASSRCCSIFQARPRRLRPTNRLNTLASF